MKTANVCKLLQRKQEIVNMAIQLMGKWQSDIKHNHKENGEIMKLTRITGIIPEPINLLCYPHYSNTTAFPT